MLDVVMVMASDSCLMLDYMLRVINFRIIIIIIIINVNRHRKFYHSVDGSVLWTAAAVAVYCYLYGIIGLCMQCALLLTGV